MPKRKATDLAPAVMPPAGEIYSTYKNPLARASRSATRELESTLLTRAIFGLEERENIEVKTYFWEGFAIRAGDFVLMEFHQVDLIIAPNGRAVVGGQYQNHLKPSRANPIHFVLATAQGQELDVLDNAMNPVKTACGIWHRWSSVVDYDSTIYQFVGDAWTRVNRIPFTRCE